MSMKEKPGYYSIIPASVRYDEDLTPNEKLMYGEITALSSKSGRAWAENSYFANLYGVHKKTVSRWISNLEKKGYIGLELEYHPGSKQVSKRYIYINDTPIHNIADRYTQKDGEGLHNIAEEELNTTRTNNTSINTSTTLTESFEKLWSLYPNKKGKKVAFTKYKKAIKEGVQDSEIEAGIKRYLSEIEHKETDVKYVKHGSTWFSQSGWQDDYDVEEKSTKVSAYWEELANEG